MPYVYEYPRPMLTVDGLLVRADSVKPQILLIQRGRDPFKGQWALPGGFVEIDEPIENAARREVQEETGITGVPLFPAGTFGRPGRDPRGRTISVLFVGTLPMNQSATAHAGDDAQNARWFPLDNLPSLAFDHADLIHHGIATLFADAIHRWRILGFLYGAPFSVLEVHRLLHQFKIPAPVPSEILIYLRALPFLTETPVGFTWNPSIAFPPPDTFWPEYWRQFRW